MLRLLDEVWEMKEPQAEKVQSLIKEDFAKILKTKTKKQASEILIALIEYLRDNTGLKLKEWEKAEENLIKEGILKKGGSMTVREVIKAKGVFEGMKKGLRKGRKEGLEKGIQEGIQKGRKEGLEKGIQEGLQKGIQKGRKEVVLNMIKNKIKTSVISKMTGVSEKDIKKLKSQIPKI